MPSSVPHDRLGYVAQAGHRGYTRIQVHLDRGWPKHKTPGGGSPPGVILCLPGGGPGISISGMVTGPDIHECSRAANYLRVRGLDQFDRLYLVRSPQHSLYRAGMLFHQIDLCHDRGLPNQF